MRTRTTKLERYMARADVASLGSHDEETQVGAILIHNKNGAVIADGCNGFVRGAPDKILPSTRPDKYKYMVHAEENLIANCARLGISMDNCTVVCTLSPCVRCMRILWQTGISQVIVKEKYTDFQELLQMEDLQINQSTTPEGFLVLTYLSRHQKPTIA